MNAVPKLETAETVAPMLGLSKQALYEAVRAGLIPHVKIGCRIRFSPDQLADWVASGGKAIEAREQR
jgi:excisionase family DNA binding protein